MVVEPINDKHAVAIHAAKFVKNGMLVGLGTGSTANYFIEEVARRQKDEQLKVTAIASSNVSMIKAQSLGLNVIALTQVAEIDIYVDGADEITPDMTLLKGRGYDLVLEKLLAKAAKQFLVVADKSKLVARIGTNFAIPIEVMPTAWKAAKRSLEAAGGIGELRQNVAKDGLTVTSHGSLVLDMAFDQSISEQALNALINNTPGVVEHGIFYGLTSAVLIAENGNIEERWNQVKAYCLFKLNSTIFHTLLLAFLLLVASCDKPSEVPVVETPTAAVNKEKVITFVTINSPNTYFVDGNNEFAGLEYDLAKLFVQELDDGTQLKFIIEKHIDQVLPNLINGKADIAAADITVTETRKTRIDFSKPYQDVQQQVVYNKAYIKKPPKNLKELIGKNISVPTGTSFAERLNKLHQLEPNLFWEERRDVDSEKLIHEVANGEVDYTIADSHLVAILQNYYPNLGVAFSIGEPEKIAWGISKQADPMLKEKANAFFTKIKNNGTLGNLIDRYHGNAKRLKPLDIKTFLIRSNTLLPKYKHLFKQAQEITGIDWRLLAAISYQESHWDTFNTSPTNVRGLMMLTEATADQMGVTDRLDPKQSIPAGAKYIN